MTKIRYTLYIFLKKLAWKIKPLTLADKAFLSRVNKRDGKYYTNYKPEHRL